MQRVAVCCSVLQVLQCVAVRCSVLQCIAVYCSGLQWVAECCSGLQWVAVCCSVIHIHTRACVPMHIGLACRPFVCVSMFVCVCVCVCVCMYINRVCLCAYMCMSIDIYSHFPQMYIYIYMPNHQKNKRLSSHGPKKMCHLRSLMCMSAFVRCWMRWCVCTYVRSIHVYMDIYVYMLANIYVGVCISYIHHAYTYIHVSVHTNSTRAICIYVFVWVTTISRLL